MFRTVRSRLRDWWRSGPVGSAVRSLKRCTFHWAIWLASTSNCWVNSVKGLLALHGCQRRFGVESQRVVPAGSLAHRFSCWAAIQTAVRETPHVSRCPNFPSQLSGEGRGRCRRRLPRQMDGDGHSSRSSSGGSHRRSHPSSRSATPLMPASAGSCTHGLKHQTFEWTHHQRLRYGSRLAEMQNSSGPLTRPILRRGQVLS